jgi:gliding motility-associated-like protein
MIFIPNAFTPREPDNNIFKPECHFIRQGSYRMRIFNRYGALIFETDDQTTGWDGRFKGEFCHLGTYIYVIEFVNSNGEKETKKGTIALIE